MKEELQNIEKDIKKTQAFCNSVNSYLQENFLIEGKTMKEWKIYFNIKIPEEINFPILIQLGQKIWQLYQRAAYFRDTQQVQLAIMEQSKADKFNTVYNNIRAETQSQTGKPLAAESCKVAATLEVKDLDNAINNQQIIHTFWVKTCTTLTELRKLLEQMGYALSGDVRIQKDFVIKNN